MKPTLYDYIQQIQYLPLQRTCEAVLTVSGFAVCPAALHYHHNYRGGLLAHTLEVVELALHAAEKFPQVNKDILIAAALWHDAAKICEYQLIRVYEGQDLPKHYLLQEKGEKWQDIWVITDYGNKIHHINGSNGEFVAHAYANEVDRTTRDAVSHCILAHHGPVKEWGSPVAPQTLEALLLHQADMQSAGYGATKEVAS